MLGRVGRAQALTPPGGQMTVTYQVAGGGHLDIDFWVRNHLWTH